MGGWGAGWGVGMGQNCLGLVLRRYKEFRSIPTYIFTSVILNFG